MRYFEIPLIAKPQDFDVRLLGVLYTFRIRYWAAEEAGWTLDIKDASGNWLARGIAMVTGANLLDQFDQLNIGGGLWIGTTDAAEPAPTFKGLGSAMRLYFREYLS